MPRTIWPRVWRERQIVLPMAIRSASLKKRAAISCAASINARSEEHTSELQSRPHLVCRLLLEKNKHSIRMELCPHAPARSAAHARAIESQRTYALLHP